MDQLLVSTVSHLALITAACETCAITIMLTLYIFSITLPFIIFVTGSADVGSAFGSGYNLMPTNFDNEG